jgi:SAM-dependent methyltransferase
MALKALADLVVRPFGYRAVRGPRGLVIERRVKDALVYQHRYAGGYDEYAATQIAANRRKLGQVWADDRTLSAIAADIAARNPAPAQGLCHGARNGWEVAALARLTGAKVIGTDISDTATQFPDMVVWDFHKENPEWAGRFDFVYTNSLDQAMEPDRALAAWARQLAPGGRIYVEHTMGHSAAGAGSVDPFGAHPMCMPYLFFTWGRGKYRLADILEPGQKANKAVEAWVFVLEADHGR